MEKRRYSIGLLLSDEPGMVKNLWEFSHVSVTNNAVVVQFEFTPNCEERFLAPLGMTTTKRFVIPNEVRDLALSEPLPTTPLGVVGCVFMMSRPAHHFSSSSINKIAPSRSFLAERSGAQVMRHWMALPRRLVASNKTSI